ncbi:ogr/Delta-like zinc finger family protein [Samsonia erythrinae]|uniref:Ogr/Delta-like zinc finger protein n=1 Tax=Samsonia erythrinae TaxID=160434 RepID=A0A4R3VSI0_9GAMM|nr:Ogr/Delta-like zinc finger protein [Samsonia erythrinae]
MITCKYCGKVAGDRGVEKIGENSYRRYHQCKNLLCGHCFTTIEELRVSTSDNEQAAHCSATCDNIMPNSQPNNSAVPHRVNTD